MLDRIVLGGSSGTQLGRTQTNLPITHGADQNHQYVDRVDSACAGGEAAAVQRRVDYELTPLGRTLLEPLTVLIRWTETHFDDILAARAHYDEQAAGTA